MVDTLRISLGNTLTELADVLDQASAFLERCRAVPEVAYGVKLAVEETVTNIIRYGHGGTPRPLRIDVEIALNAPWSARVRITDDGEPFDPTAFPTAEVHAPLSQRPIGGLGLHLVRQMAAEMNWCRRDGRNVLQVRFAAQR